MAVARYAALLRGVSPMNAKMPELKRCFEGAGLGDVVTVLSSGNVVFSVRASAEATLERRIEKAMQAALGRSFQTHVRRIDALQAMLDADPYRGLRLPPGSKRVITFLRVEPAKPPTLPIRCDDASIHALRGREAYTSYVPGPEGPTFMRLIEKTFGKDITTRTWDTIARLVVR